MAMLSTNRSEVARATLRGGLVAALVIAGILLGSRGLKDFDTALVPNAGATVFAAFGLGYRYVMWVQRPPARLYWFRAALYPSSGSVGSRSDEREARMSILKRQVARPVRRRVAR